MGVTSAGAWSKVDTISRLSRYIIVGTLNYLNLIPKCKTQYEAGILNWGTAVGQSDMFIWLSECKYKLVEVPNCHTHS